MAPDKSTSTHLPLLFSATLFTSAGLLFWIQPLIAKTLLPILGGAPAVWNTCLLFFQSMLLIGYVYALASSKWLSFRIQIGMHLVLLVLIAVQVFLYPYDEPVLASSNQGSPTLWILQTLLLSVGLPFFIISASSPLLQSWFSRSQHHLAVDPYFLFAASNAGSLIALLAFPLALEPRLGLSEQHRLWRIGFAVLVTLACAIALWLRPWTNVSVDRTAQNQLEDSQLGSDPINKIALFRRLRWLALSLVPSSLMLGVTTYVTTDVAAVPLLWVIPLALYLLTFVLAFTRRQFVTMATLSRVMIVGALVVTLILSIGATEPAWVLILANLGFFSIAALMCHTQLANDRPSATHLAEYYLWIVVGGALGSVFNVLVAPILFSSILEYPLTIVMACMLMPAVALRDADLKEKVGFRRQDEYFDLIYPLGLFVLTAILAILINSRALSSTIKLIIVPGVPLLLINHLFRNRPMRFALCLCAVMFASIYFIGDSGRTLHVGRNFFGMIRASTDAGGQINSLYSGNTIHGRQFVELSRRCEPLSYHHENGPLGQVMAVFHAAPANSRVAVIGLGVGAMASYSKPAQQWTFYEINPDVINMARNSTHFTYLQNCASGSVRVVEGDARLNLKNAQEGEYGLIVLDAFSSDAIPVHLVTQQALDLYLSKLAKGGMLAFHISSRSLNLKPILADLAASRNLICIGFDDLAPHSIEGKDPSQWVVMARSQPEISNLSINSQWQRLEGRKGTRVWSDDFSNILRAIRWQ
ncbi:MAG TPA: fused MFS/spermidine synthase [Pyrinomonadaceae bacterium]|nr:fused MFS/spermidine synthase [Pyrinomonadaceae bacterium]